MKKWLVRMALVLLALCAAPVVSANPGSRNVAPTGLERLPARLVPAARVLLHAHRGDPIAHWSRTPWKLRNGLHRPALRRIVGGRGAAQGELRFMAFLVYFDSNNNPLFLCSGTLVASNVVLTAGHCATDESTNAVLAAGSYRVVTGAVDWTNAARRTVSRVSRVIVEPGFTRRAGVPINDAALLVLSKPVGQPAIRLWSSGQISAGVGAAIAGWGNTFAGQSTPQTLLQWAPTIVQSPPYCRRFNPAYQSPTQLCAANAPADNTATCNGDSGGPLLATDASKHLFQIGVTSVGPADCDTSTADYFTAVGPIEPWASSVIRSVRPASKIPTLTLAAARLHVRQTLSGVLGPVFGQRRGYSTSCSRDSAIRVRCGVNLTSGRRYYFGTVTISYVLISGKVRWTDRYTVHSVNNHCYFRSGHRPSCPIHTRSGSF